MDVTNLASSNRYKTSRDYERLWQLAQETSVACIVDYDFRDGHVCRDIASTICINGDEKTIQISCRGICYVGPAYDGKETFIRHCAKYNVEFIDTEPATAWIPITDRLPEPGVPVIALVNPNEYGKTYRIRAQWAPAKTLELHFDAEGGEYDEETDTYYCEEGWYETNEFEDVHWNVHGTVTHWQPLPEIPEELKERQKCK